MIGNQSEEDGLALDRLRKTLPTAAQLPWFRYKLPGFADPSGRRFPVTDSSGNRFDYTRLPASDMEEGFLGLNSHTDSLGRLRGSRGIAHIDQYINPKNRKLKELVVQSSRPVLQSSSNKSTWARVCIKNTSPYVLRVLVWTYKEPLLRLVTWIPGCICLLFLMFFPVNTGRVLHGGKYAPLHYNFNGYPKSAANPVEESNRSVRTIAGVTTARQNDPSEGNKSGTSDVPMERVLRPRRLNFVDPHTGSFTTMTPDDWLEQNPSCNLEYLFIAWIGNHFGARGQDDKRHLHALAAQAAVTEGLPAFYLSASCFGDDNQLDYSKPTAEDVWQLNDVVRGAGKVAIIVGTPTGQPRVTQEELLKQFASRVWALPEILLAPAKRDILVYNRDRMVAGESIEPTRLTKNQLAPQLWSPKDADRVRRLLDHFEGNLHLTRLQLPAIMLDCLYNSSDKLDQHFAGDQSYALSGLLSIRPKVIESDSAFQAFARLSLANDSDRLLERLICMLPIPPDQEWHEMKDAWNAQLWDIEPRCQVSGIGHNDTVILDNAYGAAIRWRSFVPVAETNRPTLLRYLAVVLIHISPGIVLMSIALLIVAYYPYSTHVVRSYVPSYDGGPGTFQDVPSVNPVVEKYWKPIADTVLALALLYLLSLPILVKKVYGGKVYNSQAWLFGFEGYMPIEKIEKCIYANRQSPGRLRWSCFTSLQSRHKMDENYNCIGVDPADPESLSKSREGLEEIETKAGAKGERIFTLVDTISMTVTLFTAVRPPVGLIVCGAEGGMQRAVGVSYDWTSKTLYKETVLRVPTPTVARMHPVPRFRFGFKREAETERYK